MITVEANRSYVHTIDKTVSKITVYVTYITEQVKNTRYIYYNEHTLYARCDDVRSRRWTKWQYLLLFSNGQRPSWAHCNKIPRRIIAPNKTDKILIREGHQANLIGQKLTGATTNAPFSKVAVPTAMLVSSEENSLNFFSLLRHFFLVK